MTLPHRRGRPKRERPERRKPSAVVRSPGHLRWVRGFACCVRGCPRDDVIAAHVRSGTDGGTSMKPGDNWAIALCDEHHREQHRVGEPAFERASGINMKALATEFWDKSPHRRAWEQKHGHQARTDLPD